MQYVCGNSLHRTYKLHCLLPCEGSLSKLEIKKCLTAYQEQSHWGWGLAGQPWPPHFNFWNQQGPTISFSSIRDIAFSACSEIIWTRNFTIFIVYATIFGQYTAVSDFFWLHTGKYHFTLDFLKSFSLRTILNKTTMNES